jgi:hypothetical protein
LVPSRFFVKNELKMLLFGWVTKLPNGRRIEDIDAPFVNLNSRFQDSEWVDCEIGIQAFDKHLIRIIC